MSSRNYLEDAEDGFDRLQLPEHMKDGIMLYLEEGIWPGHFLCAILENDFVGACSRADDQNRDKLLEWARFLWNYLPSVAWGSRDKMADWSEQFVTKKEAHNE